MGNGWTGVVIGGLFFVFHIKFRDDEITRRELDAINDTIGRFFFFIILVMLVFLGHILLNGFGIHVNPFDWNALRASFEQACDWLQIGIAVELLVDLVDDDADVFQFVIVAWIANQLDFFFHAVFILEFERVFAIDGEAGLEFAESPFDFLSVHAFQRSENDMDFGEQRLRSLRPMHRGRRAG